LDGKAKEGGCAISQGVDQPRVINLLINPGISSKYGSVSDEAGGKITPDDKPGIVKEQGWEAFRWNLSEFPEDKGENNGEEKGLENKPSGTKNGLLVLGKKVPAYKKVKQVAVLPDACKIKTCPPSGWFEYGNFLFCLDEC
jgi:hypothetical protein